MGNEEHELRSVRCNEDRRPAGALEGTTGVTAMKNLTGYTLCLQECLGKLTDPQVHRDFMSGRFSVEGEPGALLQCFEELHRILKLSSRLGPGCEQSRDMSGVNAVLLLFSRDGARPKTVEGRPLPLDHSYAEWRAILDRLIRDPYWHSENYLAGTRAAAASVAGGHAFAAPIHSSPMENIARTAGVTLPPTEDCRKDHLPSERAVKSEYRAYDPRRDYQYRPLGGDQDDERQGRSHKRQGKTKRETRRRHDHEPARRSRWSEDSESSDATETSTDATGSSTPPRRGRTGHHSGSQHELAGLVECLGQPRDVVPPGTFDGQDSISLKAFLKEYEEYFHAKYRGTSRQQAKLLGQYLSGPPKQAYDALGGARAKYDDVKNLLLKWYRSGKATSRRLKEQEFNNAEMLAADSLVIYGMRLERLAQEAFPDSRRDRERQLCQKYWNSVPRQFAEVMLNAERGLVLGSRKKHLSWSQMLSLAEAEDRLQKRSASSNDILPHGQDQPSVWYSRPSPIAPHNCCNERQVAVQKSTHPPEQTSDGPSKYTEEQYHQFPTGNNYQHNGRNGNGTRTQSRSPVLQRRPVMCHYCGRQGHVEEHCWSKMGACLLCGSRDHFRANCPRNARSAPSFHPTCSACGGPHLGQECDQQPPSNYFASSQRGNTRSQEL